MLSGQRVRMVSWVFWIKSEVGLCVERAVRIPERVGGEKHWSMRTRSGEGRVGTGLGSPVLNSSMVESTISYFSSRVEESGNWSSERRCSREGRVVEWR